MNFTMLLLVVAFLIRIRFPKGTPISTTNGNGNAIWIILNNLMNSKKAKSTYIRKLKGDGCDITDQNKID